MGITDFDWAAAWRRAQDTRPHRGTRADWDARAAAFARRTADTCYADQFLAVARPQAGWTVLDAGCGAGTLALPLARLVREVTALDFSPAMLEHLRRRCREERIENVRTLLGSWEEDWDALGVGTHDLSIASRSLTVRDLEAALLKLDRSARRRVCLSAPVGDGPFDRRVLDAVGRRLQRGPDYLPVLALLHQMGIFATVAFTRASDWREFASLDDAVAGLRWMVSDITAAEERRLRDWLAAELQPHEDRWRLPAPRVMRWAVLAWDKEDAPA